MKAYLNVVRDLLSFGRKKGDRTGTGTLSSFGRLERFDLTGCKVLYPSTKLVDDDSPIVEKVWMLSGSTRLEPLIEAGRHFWNDWVLPGTEVEEPIPNPFKRAFIHIKDRNVRYGWEEQMLEYLREKGLLNGVRSPDTQHISYSDVLADDSTRYQAALVEFKKIVDWEGNPEVARILHESLDRRGVPRGKLVGGSLGRIYGEQWTRREDIQLITSGQFEEFEKRGYTIVGLLDDTGMPGEQLADRYVARREINQIQQAIDLLKHNPDSRRILVDAWNPGVIEDQSLPACHTMFEFWTADMTFGEIMKMLDSPMYEESAVGRWRSLDLIRDMNQQEPKLLAAYGHQPSHELHQATMDFAYSWLKAAKLPTKIMKLLIFCRSQDIMLGTPFNLAGYSVLAHLIAREAGLWATELVWAAGDHHLYLNHIEGAQEQLSREPIETSRPTLRFRRTHASIFDYQLGDLDITDKQSLSRINLPIAK